MFRRSIIRFTLRYTILTPQNQQKYFNQLNLQTIIHQRTVCVLYFRIMSKEKNKNFYVQRTPLK